MNVKELARNYATLTPEERFQLIFAAGDRDDEAEQQRLRDAGKRVQLSMSDHWPWAHAFEEVATSFFLDLLEEAAKHRDAASLLAKDVHLEAREELVGSGDTTEPVEMRSFDLYLAQGFVLKTKVCGWEMFCESLNLPPYALWELLPGYDRLRTSLGLLEDTDDLPAPVFRPEGMLAFLNRNRPDGQQGVTMAAVMTPAAVAQELMTFFDARADWWGA